MKYSTAISGLLAVAAAFPKTFNERDMAAAVDLIKRSDPLGQSAGETNCGTRLCPTFNEKDQFVSVTGEHAYIAPAKSDIRGPCPGLNAAANHGYLPRNGIASIEQTVSGLGKLYNLGPVISAALAAYAIALDGNIVEGVWSIGGPLPTDELTGALLGNGYGLSYAHNNYEGDSSIGRSDSYLANGDAHSLNITKFEKVYALGGKEDRYTLDKFRQSFRGVQQESIENNPYYFTGLFSTVVVVPAAYNFVINLMSNHSAEHPSGYLDGYNFKSFFAVSGEPGSFKWERGQERVPDNWYRRPSYSPYEASDVVGDVLLGYLAYPETLRFGGNVGKPNSFVGLDVEDITGGLFNVTSLLEGNNFGCFAFSFVQQLLPSAVKKPLADIGALTSFLTKHLGPVLSDLGCAAGGGQYDQGLFNQFPGYHYQPKGPATNY